MILHNEGVQTRQTVTCFFLFGLLALGAQPKSNGSGLPDGPGKAVTQKVCGGCHAPAIVMGHHETKDGWEGIVSDMVNKGANGTDDEFDQIIEYLATHFPKTDAKSNTTPPK